MAPRAQQANRVTEISCATVPQKKAQSLSYTMITVLWHIAWCPIQAR